MKLDAVADRCQDILTALGHVVVGKADVLQQILAGILANGHILIEDYPGLAKTLIARLVAQTLDLGFKRIQFTPDLLPSDITGSFLFNQREGRFEFRRGPIFTNLLLADEINRATPKTQSALLEAMQEAQVTIEGERFPLEPPFLVIATQNPIELEGTYALPEAQLDRFLMRLRVGYPDPEEEVEILARRRRRREDAVNVAGVISRAELAAMQAERRGRPRGGRDRALHRRSRAGHARRSPRRPRRLPARDARAAQARAGARRASSTRLRPARRRQGDGRPRARAPAGAEARAVGRPRLGRPGRRRPARAGARTRPRRPDERREDARPPPSMQQP